MKERENYDLAGRGEESWNFGVRLAWRVDAVFGNLTIQLLPTRL